MSFGTPDIKKLAKSSKTIKKVRYLNKYTFLHCTFYNKSLRLGNSPHKNSIWTWSVFHFKNWQSQKKKKTKKSNTSYKTNGNENKKKLFDWMIFRYRNSDTIVLSPTHKLTDLQIFFSLVIS